MSDPQSQMDMTQNLLKSLIDATKASNGLPKGNHYDYCRTMPSFRKIMQRDGRKALKWIKELVSEEIKIGDDWTRDEDLDDDDRMTNVTEACDAILERVGKVIDQADGSADKGKLSANHITSSTFSTSGPLGSSQKRVRLMHASNIPRPQDSFKERVDNGPIPFYPPIEEKPNALVPLQITPIVAHNPEMDAALSSHVKSLGISGESTDTDDDGMLGYSHPYQHELEHFESPQEFFDPVEVEQPSAQTCQWVQTLPELEALGKKLKKVKEFAVDLEAHSYRSYQGFVCLMQITIPGEDFLVDAIALREHMQILNDSFTDPSILKVLHGADSDILWLQRDFGIYIVNMFDTGQATRVLQFPRFSLAYLLKFYCDVDADKQYQVADWRIRPLSAEMQKYAREDTHYLLYISHLLRNELLAKGNETANLLRAVMTRSKTICLQRYEKPRYLESQATDLVTKFKRSLTPEQLTIFKALHKWRDDIARMEDESCWYVLPDAMIFSLATRQPQRQSQVLECCIPTPPLVRQHMEGLLSILTSAPLQKALNPVQTHRVIHNQLPADQYIERTPMTLDEVFETASWVVEPSQSSKIAKMFYSTNEQDIIDAENARKSADVLASFETAQLFAKPLKQTTEVDVKINAATEPSTHENIYKEPKTYEEIYRLSNLNRKRNKDQKRQDAKAKDKVGTSTASRVDLDKQGLADPGQFMRAISWDGSAPTYDYRTASPSTLSGATQSGSGHGASFDPYNGRNDQPRQPQQQQQGQRPSNRLGGAGNVRPRTGPRSMTFST